MAVAATYCRGQWGLTAPLVQVEVFLGAGVPMFSIVGLPATAVKESKERVARRAVQFRIRVSGRPHHRESGPGRFCPRKARPLRSAHRLRHSLGVAAAAAGRGNRRADP